MTLPAELAAVTPRWLVENAFEGATAFYTDAVLFEQSLALTKLAASRNIPVFSDLETLPEDVHELLELVNYLVAPHEVLSKLAGGDSSERISTLATPTRMVVATCGAEGSWLFEHGKPRQAIAAVPSEVVDTTGAGDAYHAGFLQATLAGHSPPNACRFASFVASAACSVFGPRLLPDMTALFSLTINHKEEIQ